MKNLFASYTIASIVGLFASSAFAEVIDLPIRQDKICNGEEVVFDLSHRPVVERMVVTTEGIRYDGFIKVIADGREIQNLGVPGFDPEYSFRVRIPVSRLVLRFERTCFRVQAVKLYISGKTPNGYNAYRSDRLKNDNWGDELLNIVQSIGTDLQTEPDFEDLWKNVLVPLKKIAILQGAAQEVRASESLITQQRSLILAQSIIRNNSFLDKLLFMGHFDFVIRDLLAIKEDILNRYSVTETGKKGIDVRLAMIAKELGQ